MNAETIIAIGRIIEALLAVAAEAPEIVSAATMCLNALQTGQGLTPAELVRIDDLLEAAHTRLQVVPPAGGGGEYPGG